MLDNRVENILRSLFLPDGTGASVMWAREIMLEMHMFVCDSLSAIDSYTIRPLLATLNQRRTNIRAYNIKWQKIFSYECVLIVKVNTWKN